MPDGRRSPDHRLATITVRTLAYGLTREQLEAERRRLLGMGWTPGEVAVALREDVA
ncbi:MAG: hypothetical protein M3N95_10845 [Actinomycetota bacterium]|nr:hypothetical protein [Actinomycetota bacterium]